MMNSVVTRHFTNGKKIMYLQKSMIRTIQSIEELHWKYLDNQHRNYPQLYPKMGLAKFMYNYTRSQGWYYSMEYIVHLYRQYRRYRKNLPRAGVILFRKKHKSHQLLTVKMYNSKMWCMPKGKIELADGGCLRHTAIREFQEETGLDFWNVIDEETPFVQINNTTFFLVHTKSKIEQFAGYDHNEIASVSWQKVSDIITDYNRWKDIDAKQLAHDAKPYSYQVYQAALIIRDIIDDHRYKRISERPQSTGINSFNRYTNRNRTQSLPLPYENNNTRSKGVYAGHDVMVW